VLLVTIALIALFSYTASLLLRTKYGDEVVYRERQASTCTTVDCYRAANFILDYLNQSVDPCENFYQFSCGTWIDRNSVEEDEDAERDQFSLAYEKVLQDISDVLSEEADFELDSPAVQNFKIFYASCVNKDLIEYQTEGHFLNYMREEFGEWPMLLSSPLGGAAEDSSEIEEQVAKLTTMRMPLLFRFETDDFNHTRILFKILIPEDFCFLQKFLPNTTTGGGEKSKSYAAFFTLVRNIQSSMLESSPSPATKASDLDTQISEMLRLADHLYFLNNARYKCGTKKTNAQLVSDQQQLLLTIGELNKRVQRPSGQQHTHESQEDGLPVFDFIKYVSHLNKQTGSDKLSGNTSVIISSLALNYLTDLFSALHTQSRTSRAQLRRSFRNLIYFHTIFSLIKPLDLFKTTKTLSQIVHVNVLLPIKYYHMFFEYSKHMNNRTLLDNLVNMFKLSREHNCAYSVIETFSVVDTREQVELQRLFVSRKMRPGTKTLADRMLVSLVNTTYGMLARQEWIDAETQRTIRATLDDLEYKIVHGESLFAAVSPPDNANSSGGGGGGGYSFKLTDVYLVNVFRLKRMFYKKEIDVLGVEQVTRIRSKKYIFDIFLANLMYLKDFNALLMPAGVVVDPIFNMNNPLYLNYATIGVYISHVSQ
jgi:hypothetical protein